MKIKNHKIRCRMTALMLSKHVSTTHTTYNKLHCERFTGAKVFIPLHTSTPSQEWMFLPTSGISLTNKAYNTFFTLISPRAASRSFSRRLMFSCSSYQQKTGNVHLSLQGRTYTVGGAVASRSVCLTPDRVVRVRVLAGDIVLCSWARHFTLTVPSPPRCINGCR